MTLWEKFGVMATRALMCTRAAKDNVMLLIDVSNENSAQFVRELYAIAATVETSGRVQENIEDEIERLREDALPCMMVLSIKDATSIFNYVRPPIGAALKEEPEDGNFRVVVISGGATLLHAPIRVANVN